MVENPWRVEEENSVKSEPRVDKIRSYHEKKPAPGASFSPAHFSRSLPLPTRVPGSVNES
jgi:hypothetical protein